MPKIETAISPQNYELIRDRIADILIDEIEGQKAIGNDIKLNKMFIENHLPIDHTNLPAIVVSFGKAGYQNRSQISVEGNYDFYIDVISKGVANDDVNGDTRAAKNVQKIMGIIRTVLQSPMYNTLGFDKPFICTTSITEITFGTVQEKDEKNIQMGRMTFNVIVPEGLKFITPVLIYEFITQVKIGESQSGYMFSGCPQEPTPDDDEVVVNVNGNYLGTYGCGQVIDIPVQYENGILTGIVDGGVVVIPNVIYNKSLSIGDIRVNDDIPLFHGDPAAKVWKINDICRTGSVKYNIYFATEQNEPSPSKLWEDDRTISSAAGSSTETFDLSEIPADSYVWIKVLEVTGTPEMFHITLIYTINNN